MCPHPLDYVFLVSDTMRRQWLIPSQLGIHLGNDLQAYPDKELNSGEEDCSEMLA